MSTPSKKPFGSTDASSYGEGDPRSPYAPKRVRGGFVPGSGRAADDDPAPPQFLLSSQRQEPGLTDFAETSLHNSEEDASKSQERRAAPRESRRRSQPAGRHSGSGDAETYGRDRASAEGRDDLGQDELRRLEESVRLLQREASSRSRPGEQSAAAARADNATSRGDDAYIEGFRVPPSLKPEILSPPPDLRGGRGKRPTVLAVIVAGVVAAPIAYYFSSSGSRSSAEQASETKLAAAESATVAIPVRPQPVTPQAKQPSNRDASPGSQRAAPETVVPKRAVTTTREPATPTREAAPTPPPAPPVSSAPPPPPVVASAPPAPPPPAPAVRSSPPPAPPVSNAAPAVRKLDPAEIDLLVKQGQQFVAAGDLVTARIVFQRAAEAGNAVAALALGASYDPVVLASLGVRGVDADVGKARTWYQKAKDYGSAEATKRLDVLANR